jgi:hypothetical protein
MIGIELTTRRAVRSPFPSQSTGSPGGRFGLRILGTSR